MPNLHILTPRAEDVNLAAARVFFWSFPIRFRPEAGTPRHDAYKAISGANVGVVAGGRRVRNLALP